MSKKKDKYRTLSVYIHPKIHKAFLKKLDEENRMQLRRMEDERSVSEVFRHLQLMYINFGEELFKIKKL